MNTNQKMPGRRSTGSTEPRRPSLPLYVRGVPASVWMSALVRVRAC